MKKFFRVIFYTILILALISATVFVTFRRKVNIYKNVISKSISYTNNPPNYNDLIENSSNESMDKKDIIYKEDSISSQSLDLYLPKVVSSEKRYLSKKSPVLIYVHGGSWIYGNKDIPALITPLLDTLREEGYTIISTSYGLLDGDIISSFDKPVSDVKDTIRWVYKNADAYNFDTDNIGLIGVSSGAHLSLLASYSSDSEFIGDTTLSSYSSKVKYVMDFFGPTDLKTLDINDAYGPLSEIIASNADLYTLYEKYSPVNYVDYNLPKTLIVHSKADTLVPYENSETLYNKLIETNNKVSLLTLYKSGHDFDKIDKDEVYSLSLEVLKFLVNNAPYF